MYAKLRHLLLLPVFAAGCRRVTGSKLTEVRSGPFVVKALSEEFNHSGLRNIDVCVADSSEHKFPTSELQCVLNGSDISGLSIEWKTGREIEISIDCGDVAKFSNYAVVPRKDSLPAEFHVLLVDKCKS